MYMCIYMSMCTGTYVCIVACASGALEATSTTLLQVLFTLFGEAKSLVTWNFPSRLGWVANEPQALGPLHFTSAGIRNTDNHIEH